VVQHKLFGVSSSFENAFKLNRTRPRLDLTSFSAPPSVPRSIGDTVENDLFAHVRQGQVYEDRQVSTTSSISSTASNIYRAITGRKSSLANRKRPTISFSTTHTDDSLRSKGRRVGRCWVNLESDEQISYWERGDYFVACTPQQAEEIDADIVDGLKVEKFYHGPFCTPFNVGDRGIKMELLQGAAVEKVDKLKIDSRTGLTTLSVADIENYQDFVPVDLNQIPNETIRNRSHGLQVLATSIPQAYRQVENMSPYYCQPLIESEAQTRQYYHQDSPIDFDDVDEWEDEIVKTITYVPKNVGSREETVAKVWFKKREFLGKKSQTPVKSLILFLLGTGTSCEDITDILAGLDERFVYGWSSRWWNGVRMPEHWELDNVMVKMFCDVCKRSDGVQRGMPVRGVVEERVLSRISLNWARGLIKRAMEGYLWWRLRGEKLGNNGGVLGVIGQSALVGFEAITSPTMVA